MLFEETLKSISVGDWRVRQVVAFDWYDGPRTGVCALRVPVAEFFFEILDERYNPDGLDDRLYRLSELPPGSVDQVLATIEELGKPVNPIWVPVWKFTNTESPKKAEQRLREIESRRRPSSSIILSQDMEQFLGYWQFGQPQEAIADWFSFLNIPPLQPNSAA